HQRRFANAFRLNGIDTAYEPCQYSVEIPRNRMVRIVTDQRKEWPVDHPHLRFTPQLSGYNGITRGVLILYQVEVDAHTISKQLIIQIMAIGKRKVTLT